MTAVLAARQLTAGYGKLAAIRDVDVEVEPGEVVAVLGPNGAGKTTLLLTLCGRLRPLSGDVAWNGAPGWKPVHRRVRDGLAVVLDDRSIVAGLSVRDNLRAAKSDVRAACEHFPALGALLGRRAGLLSGGEQQMLTVGRALSRRPDVLLIDELSQGLAPKIADTVAAAVRAASDRGMACVLVEQNLTRALAASDRFVLMNHGRIVLTGASADFRTDTEQIERHFFATRADRRPSPDPIATAAT